MAWAGERETITARSAANAQAPTRLTNVSIQPSADICSAATACGGNGVSGADAARVTATNSGRKPMPSATASANRDQASQLALCVLIASPHDPGWAQPKGDVRGLARPGPIHRSAPFRLLRVPLLPSIPGAPLRERYEPRYGRSAWGQTPSSMQGHSEPGTYLNRYQVWCQAQKARDQAPSGTKPQHRPTVGTGTSESSGISTPPLGTPFGGWLRHHRERE